MSRSMNRSRIARGTASSQQLRCPISVTLPLKMGVQISQTVKSDLDTSTLEQLLSDKKVFLPPRLGDLRDI